MKKQSRLIKTEDEVNKLREASKMSSVIHTVGMSQSVIGKKETELASVFNKLKKGYGVSGWAYPVIVGSGQRSTILHAKPSAKKIADNDLVLVDMGLKTNGYCSDITRTWPASKKFNEAQSVVYKIVLKAQKEVIKNVKPGISLQNLHQIACDYLLEGLLSKGITKSKKIEKFYQHKTSHWIGEDVHDKCPHNYKDGSPVLLSPNMCLTVEPGLYFKNNNSKYKGIGVRIEDVIRVTEYGCEVLSNVPKEIEEIEAIRALV